MTTYAAAIAARLQDAHARRGEDEDMGKGPTKAELAEGFARAIEGEVVSVWDPDPAAVAEGLLDHLREVIQELRAQRGEASTVGVERIAELEAERDRARALNLEKIQEIGTIEGERDAARMRVAELERELAEADERIAAITAERDRLGEKERVAGNLLAAAYLAREVPWTDVAAGMMTISKGERPVPFLVSKVKDGVAWVLVGKHGDQVIEFQKTPTPDETVRVLVPYVTPEQAEGLVASELGGKEVGS
jgi:hypothetical protein